MHRRRRPSEEREDNGPPVVRGTAAYRLRRRRCSHRPVAENPVDQANRSRLRADKRGWPFRRRGRAAAADQRGRITDAAAAPTSTARNPIRNCGRRRLRAAPRIRRGHPLRERQAADFQVHQFYQQRWMVRLLGREEKEIEPRRER